MKYQAEITIQCDPEHESPEDFFDLDSEQECAEACEQIRRAVDSGNLWAWCIVTVTAEFRGLRASQSLGACNYESEADFRASGYYDDMVTAAVAELNDLIADFQNVEVVQ